MSGFYLLALIAIWLFAGRVIYRIWSRWKPTELARKILHVAIGVLLFSLWFGGAFWEAGGKKFYWDAKVRELCAKDGGVKVHETVVLPPEMFNRWGQPNFYRPTQGENALGLEYIFKWDLKYLQKGNPSLQRSHTQVFRRFDNKLLGEAIDYSRGGGDLPGPWQPSSFTCPDGVGHIILLTNIFVKKNKE